MPKRDERPTTVEEQEIANENEVFRLLGKEFYKFYFNRIEQNRERLYITARRDGRITLPEGLIDMFERLNAMPRLYGRDVVLLGERPEFSAEAQHAED